MFGRTNVAGAGGKCGDELTFGNPENPMASVGQAEYLIVDDLQEYSNEVEIGEAGFMILQLPEGAGLVGTAICGVSIVGD